MMASFSSSDSGSGGFRNTGFLQVRQPTPVIRPAPIASPIPPVRIPVPTTSTGGIRVPAPVTPVIQSGVSVGVPRVDTTQQPGPAGIPPSTFGNAPVYGASGEQGGLAPMTTPTGFEFDSNWVLLGVLAIVAILAFRR